MAHTTRKDFLNPPSELTALGAAAVAWEEVDAQPVNRAHSGGSSGKSTVCASTGGEGGGPVGSDRAPSAAAGGSCVVAGL